MIAIEMPKANENLVEATLDRWLVEEGSAIQKEQSLCVIITDKATFELPAPGDGAVLRILAKERGVYPVGYMLGALCAQGEAIDEAAMQARNAALVAAHRGASTAFVQAGGSGKPIAAAASNAVRATPAARRAAKEAGVDLAAIAAALKLAGPVNEKDVLEYIRLKQ